MSVRESLAEQSSELNLHDVVIEEKGPETIAFDPREELSEEDLEKLRHHLEDKLNNKEFANSYYDSALYFKIINPEAKLELTKHALIELCPDFSADIIEERDPEDTSGIHLEMADLKLAEIMRAFFPEKFDEEAATVEWLWSRSKKTLQSFYALHYTQGASAQSWEELAEMCVRAKSLWPERAKEIPTTDGFFDALKNIIDGRKERGEWYRLVESAHMAKILFPHRFKELGIDKNVWENIKKTWQEGYSKGGVFHVGSEFTAQIMILAAKELKFTDHGIECVMSDKEDFKEPKTPMPERRKF